MRRAMLPVRDMPSAAAAGPRSAIATAGAGAKSGRMPAAALRFALRPLVAQAHEVLRERLEAGGSVEDYLRGRARLADSAVVGLLHIASVCIGLRGDTMVAPLAAVAGGGYGRSELAPGSDLDLLFLLPDARQPR